jgi:hypothetical protein
LIYSNLYCSLESGARIFAQLIIFEIVLASRFFKITKSFTLAIVVVVIVVVLVVEVVVLDENVSNSEIVLLGAVVVLGSILEVSVCVVNS